MLNTFALRDEKRKKVGAGCKMYPAPADDSGMGSAVPPVIKEHADARAADEHIAQNAEPVRHLAKDEKAQRGGIEHLRIIVCIRIAYGFKTFFIRHITIIQDIIFDLCFVESTRGPSVLLGRTRRADYRQCDNMEDFIF